MFVMFLNCLQFFVYFQHFVWNIFIICEFPARLEEGAMWLTCAGLHHWSNQHVLRSLQNPQLWGKGPQMTKIVFIRL